MIVLGLAELPARAQSSSDATSLRVAQNLSPTQQEELRAKSKMSIAMKQAIVACKAEAKGKKVPWLSRRKYVNTCVQEALKDYPKVDIAKALKDHPDMKGLPVEQSPSP
jgi:hypothetical protein